MTCDPGCFSCAALAAIKHEFLTTRAYTPAPHDYSNVAVDDPCPLCSRIDWYVTPAGFRVCRWCRRSFGR